MKQWLTSSLWLAKVLQTVAVCLFLFGIYVLILYSVSFSFRLEFYCDLCKRNLDRHFESIKHWAIPLFNYTPLQMTINGVQGGIGNMSRGVVI